MADSIREKIIKNVVTTLEGVTEAAGYDVTIRRVLRTQVSPFDIVDFPTACVVDSSEVKSDGDPANFTSAHMRLDIIVWVSQTNDPSSLICSTLAAVEKALYVDQSRGGNAIDTDVMENETYLSDMLSPYGGFRVTADIHYRHRLGDPYTK